MPSAVLTLEEQFSLPLVQDVVTENDRLRGMLNNGGTKLPDSQIENLTIPHVFKNKLLMKEGEYNGVFYPKEEIMAAADDAAEKGLVYDHLDTAGEGASNWQGHVMNPLWSESGPEGPGLYGDLKVVDKGCAQLLASGAKWGISPAIDYQKNEVDGQVIGSDLLWKSFSFVLSPAVRETMLNALKKQKGDIMPDKNDLQKDKKFPYKYPAKQQEEIKKKNKKKEDEGELQVNEKTLEILQSRDSEIADLQKFKDEVELSKKTVTVAELVANEYLIGRLSVDELADREKVLMEKSTDVLSELAEVIGSHAELSAYTNFIKQFLKANKGSSIKDAAQAWKKKKPKDKGKGKLTETPAIDPKLPGGEITEPLLPGGVIPEPAKPEEEEEEEDDSELGAGYVTDPIKPVDAPAPAGTAALTGAGNTPQGRGLAELNASGMKVHEADKEMHAFLLKMGGKK